MRTESVTTRLVDGSNPACQEASGIGPQSADTLITLGRAARDTGDYGRAVSFFQGVDEHHPAYRLACLEASAALRNLQRDGDSNRCFQHFDEFRARIEIVSANPFLRRQLP